MAEVCIRQMFLVTAMGMCFQLEVSEEELRCASRHFRMMLEPALKEVMAVQTASEGGLRRSCEGLGIHRMIASYVAVEGRVQESLPAGMELQNQIFFSNLIVCGCIGSSSLGVRVFKIWHLRPVCGHRQGDSFGWLRYKSTLICMAVRNQPWVTVNFPQQCWMLTAVTMWNAQTQSCQVRRNREASQFHEAERDSQMI